MKTVIDEILSGEPKYRIKDNNGNVLYDNLIIEQITPTTQEGTPLNKELFDSIQTDLNTRLLISSKATTAQAQSGTDDVHYMTSLKVSEYMDYARGIKYTGFDLVESTNTIDLTQYLNENVKYIDIVINCIFGTNYRAIELQGTSIKNDSGSYGGSNSLKIGAVNYVKKTNGVITLYPETHTYIAKLIGKQNSGASTGTESDMNIIEAGSFNTITGLVLGIKHSDSPTSLANYPIQVGIYQYLK